MSVAYTTVFRLNAESSSITGIMVISPLIGGKQRHYEIITTEYVEACLFFRNLSDCLRVRSNPIA